MTSAGSDIIEQEMNTVIFYLTAFAHIDGTFDSREREYIREFINKLVAYRARIALKDIDASERAAQTERWTQRFQDEFREIDQNIREYFTESVADGEDTREFVTNKLKLRCYELFKQFSPENQAKLLLLADELADADGEVHPSEARFRKELEELLATPNDKADSDDADDDDAPDLAMEDEPTIAIEPAKVLVPRVPNYDFFRAFEQNYVREPEAFAKQAQHDLVLIEKTIARWDAQRAAGAGRLRGVNNVSELRGHAPFLDGFVNILQPDDEKDYELLVLGDLHGCYSCMKAALLQADFFAKVDAHHLDPSKPEMKLVLLGDYIDRGRYSYNGIVRTAMQLFLTVPDHVYILRGNHEYYVEFNGRIYGGVRPAEAIESLTGIASEEVFGAYKRLFEAMPNTLIFDRTLFVHAGIPREDTLEEKWTDLSSLNDPEIRFQMLWSDPSEADFIPLDLQKANSRFPFGREQFKRFLNRLGCNLMLRGHERVVEGLRPVYTDPDAALLTLFSAGGRTNNDLPPQSNYREVTPMALTIECKRGATTLTPFALDYARYNKPEFNGFVEAATS